MDPWQSVNGSRSSAAQRSESIWDRQMRVCDKDLGDFRTEPLIGTRSTNPTSQDAIAHPHGLLPPSSAKNETLALH